jgi:hypothetical protein
MNIRLIFLTLFSIFAVAAVQAGVGVDTNADSYNAVKKGIFKSLATDFLDGEDGHYGTKILQDNSVRQYACSGCKTIYDTQHKKYYIKGGSVFKVGDHVELGDKYQAGSINIINTPQGEKSEVSDAKIYGGHDTKYKYVPNHRDHYRKPYPHRGRFKHHKLSRPKKQPFCWYC